MRITGLSYILEFFGAFFFILSIFMSNGNPLIIGSTLALVIFLIGKISGGMVNPAVSFAMFLNGRLNVHDFFIYAITQFLGGAGAYYAYKMI